jgi:hypothetical protein
VSAAIDRVLAFRPCIGSSPDRTDRTPGMMLLGLM